MRWSVSKSSPLLNFSSLYLLSAKGYTRYKDDFDEVGDDQRQLAGLFLVIIVVFFRRFII